MAEPISIDIAAWRTKAGLLQALLHEPGWDAYRGQLEAHEAQAIEMLVNGGDPAGGQGPEYWRGFVQGLRLAAHIPQRVIGQVGEVGGR